MRAVCLTGTDDHPNVVVGNVGQPETEPGRLIVAIAAAGITKTEPRWKTTWQTFDGRPRSQPVVLGLEFAGRIVSVGADVQALTAGQDVLGMMEPTRGGAMAEQASASAVQVLPLPRTLSYEDASVLPLAGLTAWQGIVRHGKLKPRQAVLIHGGAGGVGAFATQIARWIGARVVVTAAAKDAVLCRQLGADDVVDFNSERFEDRGERYDLVFDQIGGDVQERSWAVLKRGGRLITIAGEEADAPSQQRAAALGVTAQFFVVEWNGDELKQLSDLVAARTLRSVIGKRVNLNASAEVFDRESNSFAGKAVMLAKSS